MAYKPQGYTSLAPYLIVRDAEKTLEFVARVFGAKRLRVMRREDGSVMHAEARIDDTVLMMGQAPEGPETNVHVYVPDAVACFARALEQGAEPVQPLQDKGDGDLRAGLRDGNGAVWWISTQLPQEGTHGR